MENKAILGEIEVREVLVHVFLLIGLKSIPEGLEKEVLVQSIIKYYGDRDKDYLKAAFEEALAGAFEVDVEHYDRFSLKYFTRIMRAYDRYTKQDIKPEKKAARLKEEELQKDTISGEYFCKIVLPLYARYVNENILMLGGRDIEIVYRSLDERNFIDHVQKKAVYNKNVQSYKESLNVDNPDSFYKIIMKGKGAVTQSEKIIRGSMRELVEQTFNRWKNETKT